VSISRYFLLLPLLALLAASSPSDEETPGNSDAAPVQNNRQRLQKWKADPEHYARLQRDLHDFWTMPESKRQQLRQLDRAFHQLDAKTQKRLWKVADHYAAWLERLPEDDRRQIEQAKDTQDRLRVIRTIRERQWIERLPRKVRAELEKMPAKERSAQVAVLRKQERQQRQLWSRPIPVKQAIPAKQKSK
jgi:hypothetical protein